jgi:lysyl-tRNA synthetase class I
MAKKSKSNSRKTPASGKPSSLIDTRVIYCGDNLDQLKKFPDILEEQIAYKLA